MVVGIQAISLKINPPCSLETDYIGNKSARST